MKSRPILFTTPMVRALLDGSKTQTRRVIKPQPDFDTARAAIGSHVPDSAAVYDWFAGVALKCDGGFGYVQPNIRCPYGNPGDQLWVREAWCDVYGSGGNERRRKKEVMYRADGETDPNVVPRWTPSIHMPRWASRITLEITSVRVERLQDISEANATAEGAPHSLHLAAGRTASENYMHLWETINGDDSWDLNPWVWVIDFKRIGAAA